MLQKANLNYFSTKKTKEIKLPKSYNFITTQFIVLEESEINKRRSTNLPFNFK